MTGLPRGWVETTLGDLVEKLQYGYTAKASPEVDGPRFLRITDIENGSVAWAGVPSCQIAEEDLGRYLLRDGDLVFARTGSIEKAACVRNPPRAVFASYLIRGRPLVGEMSDWLSAFVSSAAYVMQAKGASAGIGRANINAKNLGKIRLRLAPLNEQRRIVESLDSYVSRLDEAVSGLKRVQRNLKRYRASVLQAAVEGRLVPTEAELARAEGRDFEPASELLKRILGERRHRWEQTEFEKLRTKGKVPKDDRWKKKYKEPALPAVSELPEVPEGWCWATLSQLSWDSSYGTSKKCSYDGAGEPVLRIPNVQDGTAVLDDLKRSMAPLAVGDSEFLAPGDFLVIRTNGSRNLIARAALLLSPFGSPHFFASYLIRFRLVLGEEVGRWLLACWHSPWMRRELEAEAATSAGQYNMSQTTLLKKCVPLPPLAEQRRIVTEVEHLLSVADAVQQSVADDLARSDRMKQSVLSWAFEGRLVDQDPNDEPAAALLGRVRKTREAEGRSVTTRRRGGVEG